MDGLSDIRADELLAAFPDEAQGFAPAAQIQMEPDCGRSRNLDENSHTRQPSAD
jgi:hypothetical protein